MWTLTSIALASLLWLLQMTQGSASDAYGPLKSGWIMQVALGLSVLAAVLILQRLLTYLLREWRSGENNATSELLQSIISITVFMVAILLYLSLGLGLNISSVLATSAILSVIIGLALQTTLGNLFAGVSIEIERPLRTGDFVRRDTVEGKVISLNWRSVSLQTDRGSRIVIPNNELNNHVLEVIPAEQPYRHQVEFNMGNELPPGHIIRMLMQVMCSGLPGICTSPSPSVILLGTDPATSTLKYAARFYTMQFLDRSGISSNLMERFWYSISREKMMTNPWSPDLQVQVTSRETEHDSDASILTSLQSVHHDYALPVHLLPESMEMAFAGVEQGLRVTLLSSATTMLRYGQFERCDSNAVALVLQGSLTEERNLSPQQEAACLQTLTNQLKYPSGTQGERRMSIAAYQTLLRESTLVLGPLAHDLCNRIASLTADSYLAYRAVAQSISSPADRAQFLSRSPRQSNLEISAGKWLGWAYVLDLEASLPQSRAVQECTLLIWSPAVLRKALSTSSAQELESLASLLQINVPGCEALTVARLQTWIG